MIKSPMYLVGWILIIFCWPGSSAAIAQDIQVPFCEHMEVITAPIADQAALFKEYENFQQANLYITDQHEYVMEILFKPQQIILKVRKPVTQEELNQICEITNPKKVPVQPKATALDQSGRKRLIGSSLALSLGYYGFATPAALHLLSENDFGTTYLMIGGAGFFVPYLATRNAEVTKSMASAYAYGGVLGIAQGWAITGLLQGFDINPRTGLGISAATSVGQSVLSLYLAKRHKLSEAQVKMIGSAGAWGTGFGAVVPIMLGNLHPRLLSTGALAGSGLGYIVGNFISRQQPLTSGDVTVINVLGGVGLLGPVALISSLHQEQVDERAYLGGIMLGAISGMSYGLSKTSGYNYTKLQGNLITLGTGAGYLVGGSIGYGIMHENDPLPSSMLWCSSLGAVAGFFLTDWLVRTELKSVRTSADNLNIEINPTALTFKRKSSVDGYNDRLNFSNSHLIKASWRF